MFKKTSMTDRTKKQQNINNHNLVSLSTEHVQWIIEGDWELKNRLAFEQTRYFLPCNLFRASDTVANFGPPGKDFPSRARWLLYKKDGVSTQEDPVAWAEAHMKEQSFAIYEMMIGQHPNSQIPPTLEELSLLISSVFLAKRPDLIFLYTNTPAVQSLFQFIPKERVYDVWSPHNSPFSANAVGTGSYYQKLLISSSTWFEQSFAQADRTTLSYLDTRYLRKRMQQEKAPRKGLIDRLLMGLKKKQGH